MDTEKYFEKNKILLIFWFAEINDLAPELTREVNIFAAECYC